ncbi:VCBS repeat-containing protein [Haloferula sp. BvORR071]|uniref:FG-GAP repeat domain-containing protein n=1 Tax=Haloferula sp. BvORR071 TaxID=1396141 RepID=UPI000696D79E|nr:VCBS repeat-containing protein [Haloferula sp. BvORR071]
MKPSALLLPAGLLALAYALAQSPPAKAKWTKQVVSKDFLSEGLGAGDIDGDGVKDLVAGAFWFKGPDFKEAKQYRPGAPASIEAYMEDSFLAWVTDVTGDGKNDILMARHPGRGIDLYVNPGKEGEWTAHRVMAQGATESPIWVDLDGDKKNEMVCMEDGKFGYYKADWSEPTKPWTFVAISDKRSDSPYVHGLGAGDLNGDGRVDIVEKQGWFEQPAKAGEAWTWHQENFAGPGGAQMLVFDVDGDKDNDMVTSLNGHGYGLAWYENEKKDGKVSFTKHEILPEDPAKTGPDGLQFSQLHGLDAGDFDKDGRIDFITGKRFWAHMANDPGSKDPALAVVFYNRKDGDGVKWVPEVIDTDSGVGCQVLAVDLDGDGKLEFAAGSKKGVHVIRQ